LALAFGPASMQPGRESALQEITPETNPLHERLAASQSNLSCFSEKLWLMSSAVAQGKRYREALQLSRCKGDELHKKEGENPCHA